MCIFLRYFNESNKPRSSIKFHGDSQMELWLEESSPCSNPLIDSYRIKLDEYEDERQRLQPRHRSPSPEGVDANRETCWRYSLAVPVRFRHRIYPRLVQDTLVNRYTIPVLPPPLLLPQSGYLSRLMFPKIRLNNCIRWCVVQGAAIIHKFAVNWLARDRRTR